MVTLFYYTHLDIICQSKTIHICKKNIKNFSKKRILLFLGLLNGAITIV